MSMELIDRNKLMDYFFYGVNDKPITWSAETDKRVIQVIETQPIIKAIPIERLEQIREHFEAIAFFNGTVKADYVLRMLDKALKEQDE